MIKLFLQPQILFSAKLPDYEALSKKNRSYIYYFVINLKVVAVNFEVHDVSYKIICSWQGKKSLEMFGNNVLLH